MKYRVVDPGTGVCPVAGVVDRVDAAGFEGALTSVLDELDGAGVTAADLRAVGHRVVHGGSLFTAPTLLDDRVVEALEDIAPLAPLHNPPAVAGIRRARSAFPGLPHVAVFDTAWFADLPPSASTYALDRDLMRREDLRRYGMHGISHRHVARAAAELLGRDVEEVDQIVLHLGNGASATAVRRGRPVDTSMGLTPLEGLVMGTRGGDVDPGVLIHLLRHGGLSVDELDDLLQHRSGLQGLAGVHDFRDLVAAVDAGDDEARLAYDVYCHRLRKYVGAYLAVLGGADVITFTAGVGEHHPRVRADALSGLQRLGIDLDEQLNNATTSGARVVSTPASPVAVLVVPTDEEREIASQVVSLLATSIR
ncbi:acetate kinase [Nocardioides sp.]|uniref:acetate kinase n=1 Tax=Nocardioides sp. TaxID=35761 RepID=UPI0027341C40|nr:acetate kinase [Nocardioides sp.]MDP3894817.1 acetate kinase [Nocardioides sp.]